jgi:hypothetical protein
MHTMVEVDAATELGLTGQERLLAERIAAVVGEFSDLLTAGRGGATRRDVAAVAVLALALADAATQLSGAFTDLLSGDAGVRMGKVRQAASCAVQSYPVGRLLMNMTTIGVPPGLASRVAAAAARPPTVLRVLSPDMKDPVESHGGSSPPDTSHHARRGGYV